MTFAPRESPIDTSFKAVLLDGEMRVLLGSNPRGEWELLGGRAEAQDASSQDTVRREVREEAGIDIVVGAIVDTWFYDIPGTGRVAVTSYLARPVGDVSLALGTEHADLAFFHARELDDINLPEGYRRSIRLGIDQLQARRGCDPGQGIGGVSGR
nr:NUDIX hydrolase [Streptomyces griseorubiginosus]